MAGSGKATRRKLQTMAKALRTTGRVGPTPRLSLKPGARLVREMGRPHAHRHGNGGWVRVCREKLSVADQDRQKDHRSALVGSALLWAISGRCGAPEQWGARWVNRTRRRDAPPQRHAVYDDGGFSGGTMERPALKRLIADIEEGQMMWSSSIRSTG